MDNIQTAEQIAKTSKAFKFVRKVLKKVKQNGTATVKLGCTGAEIVIDKGSVWEQYFRQLLAKYAYEIQSYQFLRNDETRTES